MLYLTMFLEFFKVGLFSVGGGLATLPFLFELTKKYSWFTAEELTNMIAVSESSPGPIGVNMATYVGNTTNGVLGGILTTFALVLPSLIVILIVASILKKFKENKTVKNLFYGLRAAVAGLLVLSVLSVFQENFVINGTTEILQMLDYKKLGLFAVLVFLVFKLKKHPLLYISIGAVAGIVLNLGA